MRFTARRPSGYSVEVGPEGKTREADTLTCVHCGRVWEVAPGSGHKRGWCSRCGGPTCGSARCGEGCDPFDKALEAAERRAQLWRQMDRALGG